MTGQYGLGITVFSGIQVRVVDLVRVYRTIDSVGNDEWTLLCIEGDNNYESDEILIMTENDHDNFYWYLPRS